MTTADRLSHVIGLIYDCVIDPDRWPDALNAIVDECGFANCGITVHHPSTYSVLLHVLVRIDRGHLEGGIKFADDLHRIWGGAQKVVNQPIEEPLIQSQASPPSTWNSNAYYREVLAPRGLHDAVVIGLQRDPRGIAVATFGQHASKGPINEEDLTTLRLIAPHLRRAIVISGLLEQERSAAETFTEVLEGIAAGSILVDEDMEIVHANASARKMIAKGDPILSRGGKLVLPSQVCNTILTEAVVKAARNEAGMERRSIDIPISNLEGSPTVVQLLPLRRRKLAGGVEQRAVAAVFVSDAASAPKLPADAMALLYNLTPAETRVFELVVAGYMPAAIAEHLGIGVATVRTHLSRLFEKTGCTRQAELIAMASKVTLTV